MKNTKARVAGLLPCRRLLQRRDFLALKNAGKRVHAAAFVLQFMPVAAEPGVAVGFTCSGALGNAVRRNRARRRLQAAFDTVLRLNPKATLAHEGVWLVLVGKMPLFEVDFKVLCRELAGALVSAGIATA